MRSIYLWVQCNKLRYDYLHAFNWLQAINWYWIFAFKINFTQLLVEFDIEIVFKCKVFTKTKLFHLAAAETVK